jgi:hypothetical protein
MKTLLISFLLAALCCGNLSAAEYQGEDIDGQTFDATAYSYSTSKYYSVQVEFEGDEVIIYFPNGGHRTLTLDDEEIDDPHSISAYDFSRTSYWEIDVDGMD